MPAMIRGRIIKGGPSLPVSCAIITYEDCFFSALPMKKKTLSISQDKFFSLLFLHKVGSLLLVESLLIF